MSGIGGKCIGAVVERSCAVTAVVKIGGIFKPTLRTYAFQCFTALAAEFNSLGIFKGAVLATHIGSL